LRKAGGSTGVTYFAPNAGGELMAENDNGSWVDYVRLNGRLVGRIGAGQAYAIHADQLGRPETVTDPSRNVVWRAQNFPFAQKVTLANVSLNLGFPGQYYDAETWTWNNGYRDYVSGFGRYLESDPIGIRGGVDPYAYVGDNPITGFDTFGLQDESVNKQQAENGVQGVVNEAGAILIPDRAGAISDIGGSLAGGAVAMGSVYHSLAQQDYRDYTGPEGGIHDYPERFGDMNWSQYPTFEDAWKAYLQKRMGKKCPWNQSIATLQV
jgi:RHS repeat-associated protein